MPKTSLQANITNDIIQQLEEGTLPWRQPWKNEADISLPLRHTGEPYTGMNVILLWMATVQNRYKSPTWMTYAQAQKLGGQVQKDEKSTLVVRVDRFPLSTIPVTYGQRLVSYRVFNVEQIKQLPPRFYASPAINFNPDMRIKRAEEFFAALYANVVEKRGVNPCYFSQYDTVLMPPFENFQDARSYYATLSHEIVHWTSHNSRLDRNFSNTYAPESAYAIEELVAEIGCAFVSASLGIKPDIRNDHAPYIATWIRLLKNDEMEIFRSANYAAEALTYLKELASSAQPVRSEQPAPEPQAPNQAISAIIEVPREDIRHLNRNTPH